MIETNSVKEFLESETIRLRLPQKECGSRWLSELLKRNSMDVLNVSRNQDRLEWDLPLEGLEITIQEREEKSTLAVVYNGRMEVDSIALFGMDSQVLPSGFSFIQTEIEKLDTSYLAIFEDDDDCLETEFLVWKDKIVLIPELLDLEQIILRMTRQGIFQHNYVQGRFQINDTLSLYLGFEFGCGDQLTMSVGAENGAFPSFGNFMQWVAKEVSSESMFSWLDVGKGYLDIALSAASITLDMTTGKLADAMMKLKMTLFHMDFEVTFYLASKTLYAGLWEGTEPTVGEILHNIGGIESLPEYLSEISALKASQCDLNIQLENKTYSICCRVEGDLHIGPLVLKYVELEVINEEERTCVSVRGSLMLETKIGLGEIPLLTEILPPKFTYEVSGVSISYEEGYVTGINMVISYQMEHYKEGKAKQRSVSEVPPVQMQQSALSKQGGTSWKQIQKHLGPVHIDQLGMSFEEGLLLARITGGIKAGPVELGLKGLSVGYDLNKKAMLGGLSGLDIYYKTASFSIEGGIARNENTGPEISYQYDGAVLIHAAKWQFSGMASYARTKNKSTSIFVYMNLCGQFGGVPAFELTGIMGGFGVNRRLNLPEISQIEQFPLMDVGSTKGITEILDALTSRGPDSGQTWIEVKEGDYFAAAGITFTSFGLVKGKALLTLLFGTQLQMALLGSAELTLPKNVEKEKAYAYVKILFAAVLKPEEGSLTVNALLSGDSFLICKDCHLSGGAAFALWFGENPNAGDFVLTLGGYHPAFQKPEHYPTVDRIGFQWQVCKTISAKGEAYMAVTPSCIMAGGSLQFLFESGPIKAWFNAYMDVIMYWHPFYFEMSISIDIGVSLRLNLLFCHKTLTLTAGASLGLWGPEIGGRAKIHLSIISFTVAFGKEKEEHSKTLDWNGFSQLLPDKENIHRINVEAGISEEKEGSWISRNGEFILNAETEIPAGAVGIRPMGISGVQSQCMLNIITPNQQSFQSRMNETDKIGLHVEEVRGSFPEALWGNAETEGRPRADLVKGLISGYRITGSKECTVSGACKVYGLEELIHYLQKSNPLSVCESEDKNFLPDSTGDTMKALLHLESPDIQKKRQELCERLFSYYQGPPGEYGNLAQELDVTFDDQPMLCGEE